MSKLEIAVLDDYTQQVATLPVWNALRAKAEITFFSDHLDDETALARRLERFDVVVLERERTKIPGSLIRRLPRLTHIAATGPVNWTIDYAAARERGIAVSCTEGSYDETPELTWGLVLALSRRLVWEERAVREGRWQTGLGQTLRGKTLALMGLGNVGKRVAEIANLFGMKVIAWSENLTDERARAAGAERVTFDELIARADFLSVHVVLSDRTRGRIDAAAFARMKPTAYLINTSRGPIVDEAALVEALRAKRIAGAALDVFDVEPLPPDHPLRGLNNAIVTPHLGYVTIEQYQLFYGQVVENIANHIAGRPIRLMPQSV